MKGNYISAMLTILAEMGIDRNSFIEECGIKESDLRKDNLIGVPELFKLWNLANLRSKSPGLGLIVGDKLNINTHGSLGYALMASSTYEEALRLLAKYYKVQAPRATFKVNKTPDFYHLITEPTASLPDAPWFVAEFMVSSIYKSSEFLFSDDVEGLSVSFSFSAPPHAEMYSQYIRVPFSFDQAFNGLIIPKEKAKQPLPSSDPIAANLFEEQCAQLIKTTESHLISGQIKNLQSQNVGHFLSQTQVAKLLNMSVSSLHRKLADEGTNYKKIVSGIKKDIAVKQVCETNLSVEAIAHLLGFSDASNFRRSFVSWTGKTPSEYRAAKLLL